MDNAIDRARAAIRPLDEKFDARAQVRLDMLTKPRGSLGRLEDLARRLVCIYRDEMPAPGPKVIFTFAGDHGVARSGVSAYPREVTPQMVLNFLRGGAAINVLARHAGAEVAVVDVGVDYEFGDMPGLIGRKVMRGTRNITEGPAMTPEETMRAMGAGYDLAIEYAARGVRMIGTGEMGIGNTTPSSAIAAVMTGLPVADVTGRGTGIGDETWALKVRSIERAIMVNRPDRADPLGVLGRLGGTEIAAIAGVCLGGAASGLPVVIDGFISTVGALMAGEMVPASRGYMFAAHRSVEIGHGAILELLGLEPLLDLGMRLGEGTGAALAMTLLDASLKLYSEMATFGEAGVSDKG